MMEMLTGPAPASLVAPRGRVRLRTLVLIRWSAVVGQALALLVVRAGFGYELPMGWALAVVATSAIINVVASLRPSATWLSDGAAALFLAYDLLQVGALLYLTGGMHNPFAILILAPVTVAATVLSRRSTAVLAGLAVLLVLALSMAHRPLPWADHGFRLQPLFIVGLALALGLSTLFIAGYVFSVAEEARRMSHALSATQMALDRERRLSALGGLAAAAAHELGSPLGTIAVVAREIARDLPPDSPLRPDIDLLLSQSERCREILAGLAARPDADRGVPFDRLPLDALVDAAAAPYRGRPVAFKVALEPAEPGAPTPGLPARPELLHGLGTLIENATQFARREVRVVIRWDATQMSIAILDDGPGFDPAMVDRLGEPYLSTGSQGRQGDGEHMGLGVFIAQNLLERTGAKLHFGNRPSGGAEVTATWTRFGGEE
ncbi:MAG: ActS/PrrB/RegB family redox-sensitive histidine kinase [Dongiaceae bacterium]